MAELTKPTTQIKDENLANLMGVSIKLEDIPDKMKFSGYTAQSTSSPYYGVADMNFIYNGIIGSYNGIKIPNDAKTVIDTRNPYGIKFIVTDKGKTVRDTVCVIPHIKDIQVIHNRVVVVLFADGTKEKAVLDDADIFSLEQGISVCITKKMLSLKTGGNGSSAYNKIISHCLKVYENNRNAEEKAKLDEQAARDKENKTADKARAKRIKRANKEREREIEIQKEAYLRAMREFGGNSAVND